MAAGENGEASQKGGKLACKCEEEEEVDRIVSQNRVLLGGGLQRVKEANG